MFGAQNPANTFGSSNNSFGSNSTPATSFGQNAAGQGVGFGPVSNNQTTGFGAGSNIQTGGFGSTQSFAAPSSGIFGSNAQTPAPVTAGMFGSSAQTPAANVFGASAQNPANNLGMFGSNSQTPANNRGLFGSNNQTPANTGGMFGQNTQIPPNTGGMFGQNTPAVANTGGMFGQNTPAVANTGGMFGQNTPAVANTGGMFGQNTPAVANTGGMFGQNTPAVANTGGMFGANVQQQPATQSSGLFAQNSTTSGNMFSQPAQNQMGMFGSNLVNQPQIQQAQQPQAIDYIKYLAGCWDLNNPDCQFKHYFYNLVHPSEVHLYQPSTGEDQQLYNQAQQNNPDSSWLYDIISMVPVLAIGFDGLKTRLAAQEEVMKIHAEKIEEIKSRIEKLNQTRVVETQIKLQEYKRRQRQIVHKVVQIMKSVQLIRNSGYSLRGDEESLITRMLAMDRDLEKPAIFRGRVNELWARVQQIKDANRLLDGPGDRGTYIISDPRSLETVCETLGNMSKGLVELSAVIREDDIALDTISLGYKQPLKLI